MTKCWCGRGLLAKPMNRQVIVYISYGFLCTRATISFFFVKPTNCTLARKNLRNTAYPEIVFCYRTNIRQFILPHIVLYFIFRRGFLVTIVSHRAHEDAHRFCLYFISCHAPVKNYVSTKMSLKKASFVPLLLSQA